MHVTAHAVQEQFYEARMAFEDLIAQLLSPAAAGLSHSQAEDLIEGLAELWCEALLENLRRNPIERSERKVS